MPKKTPVNAYIVQDGKITDCIKIPDITKIIYTSLEDEFDMNLIHAYICDQIPDPDWSEIMFLKYGEDTLGDGAGKEILPETKEIQKKHPKIVDMYFDVY